MIDWTKVVTCEDKARCQNVANYESWKSERQAAVDAITVTVDGLSFDGNETSQARMARAITAFTALEQTIMWTLADNSVAEVTISHLKAALTQSVTEQTRIWNDGRPAT